MKHLYCNETIDGQDQNLDQNDFDYTKNYTHAYSFNENNFYIPLYQQCQVYRCNYVINFYSKFIDCAGLSNCILSHF